MSNTLSTIADHNLTLTAGSLNDYINAAYQLPVLTAEEEKGLAYKLKNEQDLEAARQLITHHLRFVVQVARGYNGYGLAMADLIQEGNIGLMKAVKRFDPDLNVRLVSFAVHWIRAEIHEFILRNWRIVKVATTKAQRKLFFNLRSKKTRLAWLTQSELENIASDLGVKPSEVLEMESRLSGQDIGFDAPSSDNDTEHTLSAPEAYLSNNEDPASLTEKNDFMKHQLEQLTAGLDCLDSRSREIVRARWLDEEKATLHQLANKYNVSAERIRQLESNALKKLQGSIVA